MIARNVTVLQDKIKLTNLLDMVCSVHVVQIFSLTPVQLAARQWKVEKEKETLARWWRCIVLGA